jgi:ribose/xylose/arabinose/galactoside ABC-type transport system permease subunit/ABC-type Mn2+/Zn2+ transport system ATPase subunit
VSAGIAYLPEDRLRQGICPGLSVRANAVLSALPRLGAGLFTRSKKEEEATRTQVNALGIRLRSISQPIRQLSGGNQQKVVLARWLLAAPRVLILDEPTRGVDVGAKAEIHRLIRQLADTGKAIILVSSELPEVMAHSDRIAVFRSGRIAGLFDARTTTPFALAHAALPDAEETAASRMSRERQGGSLGGRISNLSHILTELGLIAALLLISGCLAVTTGGRFLATENLLGVLSSASVLTILALGSAAVMIAGGIDISVGSLLALAAASGGLMLARAPGPAALSVGLSIVAALAVGLAGGCLNAALALGGRIHPIVVTLGTLTVYRGLLLSLTGGDVVGELPPSFRMWGIGRFAGMPASVIMMLAIAILMQFWLGHTRSGRFVFAFGSNPRAARLVGVGQGRVWLNAFGVGGLCAALAGLLELAQNGSMQSVFGTGYELRAIAAAVIGGTAVTGGRGSVIGVVLGALLLSLIQNALVLWAVSRYHYDLVIGSLLLAAILLDLLLRKRLQ